MDTNSNQHHSSGGWTTVALALLAFFSLALVLGAIVYPSVELARTFGTTPYRRPSTGNNNIGTENKGKSPEVRPNLAAPKERSSRGPGAPVNTADLATAGGPGVRGYELDSARGVRDDLDGLSKLFESYARLLTILVTVISALSVVFGFVVRRSIREIEQEVRSENARLLSEVRGELNQLRERSDKIVNEHRERMSELQKWKGLYDEAVKGMNPTPGLRSGSTRWENAATELENDPELK